MDEFYSVCEGSYEDVGKDTLMVFERKEEMYDFRMPYQVSVLALGNCRVV